MFWLSSADFSFHLGAVFDGPRLRAALTTKAAKKRAELLPQQLFALQDVAFPKRGDDLVHQIPLSSVLDCTWSVCSGRRNPAQLAIAHAQQLK